MKPTDSSVGFLQTMPTNQDRKESRHQRILDAALSVFSRQGYHEAAVDEIASLAGKQFDPHLTDLFATLDSGALVTPITGSSSHRLAA